MMRRIAFYRLFYSAINDTVELINLVLILSIRYHDLRHLQYGG